MQKYQDIVLRQDGHPAVGALIVVTNIDGTAATIYSTNSTSSPISGNSVVADITGEYWFYAANGHYNLSITYPAYAGEVKSDVLLFDPADGSSAALPVAVKGDLLGFNTAPARVPVGNDTYVLIADTSQPLGVRWGPATASVPITTKGDLLGFSSAAARIPVGSNNQVLTADNTQALGVKWATPAAGTTPPVTTKGDIYGFSTVGARVPIGADNQVLTADSTQALGLKWANPGSLSVPVTTKGDLFGFSTVNARVPVGSNNQVLTADSTQTLGVRWAAVPSNSSVSVFSVLDYGAVGDGSTNDYAAVASALSALYANKGGTLLFPFKPLGYVLGSSVVVNPGSYLNGSGITIELSGNHITQTHNGWMFDLCDNYFGTNNGNDEAGFKRTDFRGSGAYLIGTATASGCVRMYDNVRSRVGGYTAKSYTAGIALRLQVTDAAFDGKGTDKWCEMNTVYDIHSIGTLTLLHLMAGGNLDGLNANTDRYSSFASFLGCKFTNLVHQGDVNNAIGFDIEGSGNECVWVGCGGFVNQNSTTGGKLFNFNGTIPGTFISPFSDVAGNSSPLTDVVFGANANITNEWARPLFIDVANIALPHNWRDRILVISPIKNFGTNTTGNSPREVLNADRTIYVNGSTGADTNAGTNATDATGKGFGPFLTIAKALSFVQKYIDAAGFNIIIQIADGTYTTPVAVNFNPVGIGAGTFTIRGNTGTPGNVILSTTSANAMAITNGAKVVLEGIEFRTTTSGTGLSVDTQAQVTINTGNRFGVCATRHISVSGGGQVIVTASYTISGNAPDHWFASAQSQILAFTGTITASSRAFSGVFARCSEQGYIGVSATFVNTSSTGGRYFVDSAGLIQTFGSGATYFPGNAAGSVSNNGLYL